MRKAFILFALLISNLHAAPKKAPKAQTAQPPPATLKSVEFDFKTSFAHLAELDCEDKSIPIESINKTISNITLAGGFLGSTDELLNRSRKVACGYTLQKDLSNPDSNKIVCNSLLYGSIKCKNTSQPHRYICSEVSRHDKNLRPVAQLFNMVSSLVSGKEEYQENPMKTTDMCDAAVTAAAARKSNDDCEYVSATTNLTEVFNPKTVTKDIINIQKRWALDFQKVQIYCNKHRHERQALCYACKHFSHKILIASQTIQHKATSGENSTSKLAR